jgi:hypothetical protein
MTKLTLDIRYSDALEMCHERSTTLYRIKNMGRWCPQYAGYFPCGLIKAKKIVHSKGSMFLSMEYINLCDPMQWMCNEGHKWFASSIVLSMLNLGVHIA